MNRRFPLVCYLFLWDLSDLDDGNLFDKKCTRLFFLSFLRHYLGLILRNRYVAQTRWDDGKKIWVLFDRTSNHFRFSFYSSQEAGKIRISRLMRFSLLCILFRTIDQANPYFLLQRRRGYDERRGGLASYFAAKLDSVLDNKVNFDWILSRDFEDVLNR